MATILIVDDAEIIRSMLKTIVTNMGHQVIGEASTGAGAVRSYRELKPDLVTLDITMPDMDGLRTLKTIISQDPSAKIIMCSAVGLHHMIIDAINAGAKEFIVKPFQKDRVEEAISNVLSCR